MKTIILGIVISAASFFSLAPSGQESTSISPVEVEIFPSAEAATCRPRNSSCMPYPYANTCCAGLVCHATSPYAGVCR